MPTDVGKEFVNTAVLNMLRGLKIHPTTAGGYDPRANGQAGRYVGRRKQKATSYLIHAKMPVQLWCWAATQAAHSYRAKVLVVRLPRDDPTLGTEC